MDDSLPEVMLDQESLDDVDLETPTGQSRLAYRLAAVILLTSVILTFFESRAAQNQMFALWDQGESVPESLAASANIFNAIIGALIPTALAVGLLLLRKGARTLTLLGATFVMIMPIIGVVLSLTTGDSQVPVLYLLETLALPASVILLLTGRSQAWRLGLGIGLFVLGNVAIRVWVLAIS